MALFSVNLDTARANPRFQPFSVCELCSSTRQWIGEVLARLDLFVAIPPWIPDTKDSEILPRQVMRQGTGNGICAGRAVMRSGQGFQCHRDRLHYNFCVSADGFQIYQLQNRKRSTDHTGSVCTLSGIETAVFCDQSSSVPYSAQLSRGVFDSLVWERGEEASVHRCRLC